MATSTDTAPRRPWRRHWWSVQPPRPDTLPISTGRAYPEVLAVFAAFFASGIAAAAFSLAGLDQSGYVVHWTDSVPGSIDAVALTGLSVALPLLLVARRGLGPRDLGLAVRGQASASSQIRMAAWAMLALVMSDVLASALAGPPPKQTFSYPGLALDLVHSTVAGPIEEIVVLAFVVVTLEQARRPRWELIALALALRSSYHIYYGPGTFATLIWASVFLWLFLRFRTIIPLIVVHSLWDVTATLADRWDAVGGVMVLVVLALFVTAPILWLVERSARRSALPPRVAPLGNWYPDPSGQHTWRWWDGWSWSGWVRDTGPGESWALTQPGDGKSGGYGVQVHAVEPRRGGRKVAAFALATVVVLFLGAVTVFGLSGANADRDACNHDARMVVAAVQAYFSDHHAWPPAGPVNKTSVLLTLGPKGPYLRTAPSNGKYSINTDGAGGVLVAVPAGWGGINYDNANNPCDALGDD